MYVTTIWSKVPEASRPGFSIPLFLLQLFTVPLVNLVLGWIAVAAVMSMAGSYSRRSGYTIAGFHAFNLVGYLVSSFQGFFLGYAFQFAVPRAKGSGGP